MPFRANFNVLFLHGRTNVDHQAVPDRIPQIKINNCIVNSNADVFLFLIWCHMRRCAFNSLICNYTAWRYLYYTLPTRMSFWKTSIIDLARLMIKNEWIIIGVSSSLINLYEPELSMYFCPIFTWIIPFTLE